MAYIYKITNIKTDQVYIGSTTNYKQRERDHKCNFKNKRKKSKLYQAMERYGYENFKMELIEEVERDKMLERETYYIKKYNSVENGYNTKYRIEHCCRCYEYEPNKIIEEYQRGMTQKELALKYKTDKKEISKILKTHNVKIRDWNKEQSNPMITREYLENEYVKKRRSIKSIAIEANLSDTAIRNWIKKFNICPSL